MPKPTYETLQKKAARLEKELARLTSTRIRDDAHYRDLVENVNSIILRMDIEGNITYLNTYALKFFGYSSDEIIGRNVIGTIVPESETTGRDLAALLSAICKDPEQYASNENENMKKDGSRVYISWSNRAVTDEKGLVTEVICVGNDITGLKEAETAARVSEEKFYKAFNRSPLLTALSTIRDGRFVDVNDRFLEVTGYRRDEVLGNTSAGLGLFLDNEERASVIGELKAKGSVRNIGLRIRTKSGEVRWGIFSADILNVGREELLLTMMHDGTEGKRAEEALRESEEKFRLLAENARDVIWLADLKLNPVYVSRSIIQLCGYTPEDMVGLNLEEMLAPQSRELVLKFNAENAAVELSGRGDPARTMKLDLEFRRKDGSTVWTESIVAYQRDLQGRAVGIVGVTRDITERRITQAENETISRISRLFLSPGSMPDIYRNITSIMTEQFGFPVTGIIQYDRDADEIVYLGSSGIPSTGPGLPRFPAKQTMTGTVVMSGNPIVELDVTGRPDYAVPALRALGVKTFICEPIIIGGEVFGAIVMGDSRIRPEAPRLARTIRIIADYLSGELSRRKVEETLRESEELTSNLMTSVNEGIVIFSRELRVLLWNRFMEELTGVSSDEVLGRIFSEIFPQENIPSMFNDMSRSLNGETFRSEDLAYEFVRSGRKGWLVGQYTPLRNLREDIIGIIVSIRDITRRMMVEQSLGRTREDLRETLEATTDGIWTWNARDDHYYFSPRFYTMLGYEPGEFPPCYADFKSLIHPDDLERALSIIRNYISSGQEDAYENEYRLKTSDGSYRWIYSRARVVERDREGRVVRLIGNHEDITERKTAEESLKGQLAVNMALAGLSGSIISQSYDISDITVIVLEYARLLTESEDGYVCQIDPDSGDCVILSTTFKCDVECAPGLMGTDRAGGPQGGRGLHDGLGGDPHYTRQAFFTNAPRDHESWEEPPPGHPPVERFLSVPVLFYNELVGQIVLLNAARDYTENDLVTMRRIGSLYAMAINRIRNENRIMASLHEKEVLIKELHHRVKNNMQVVSSLLALQSRKVDDERYRKYFEESQNRIHAMAMVHEKLYRSEDMARVDFSEYIVELTRHLFYMYNINRRAVHLRLDIGKIYLGIDTAIPCAMIINELVTNALEHAFPAGREGNLTVSFRVDDECGHLLTVRDDGIGMPDDFSIGNSETLGMQIVQSLTRQIRGTLEVRGEGGTHVMVRFNGSMREKKTAERVINGSTQDTDCRG